jgi:DNA-binding transcriptional ArsR family regulator
MDSPTKDEHSDPPSNAIDDDQYYRLLADEHRRLALATLAETGVAPLDTLAEAVTGESAVEQSLNETTLQLHHTHLPMLNDAGVVAYDPVEKHVELIESIPRFED